jgi:hypothetical protein
MPSPPVAVRTQRQWQLQAPVPGLGLYRRQEVGLGRAYRRERVQGLAWDQGRGRVQDQETDREQELGVELRLQTW